MLISNDTSTYRNTYINSDIVYKYNYADHTYSAHIITTTPAPITLTGPSVTTS